MAAIRMATVTRVAVVRIAGLAAVVVVHLGLIVVLMAVDAAEHLIVASNGVAFGADIPFIVVLAAINGEVLDIMVEAGGVPRRGGVAHGAIRRVLL